MYTVYTLESDCSRTAYREILHMDDSFYYEGGPGLAIPRKPDDLVIPAGTNPLNEVRSKGLRVTADFRPFCECNLICIREDFEIQYRRAVRNLQCNRYAKFSGPSPAELQTYSKKRKISLFQCTTTSLNSEDLPAVVWAYLPEYRKMLLVIHSDISGNPFNPYLRRKRNVELVDCYSLRKTRFLHQRRTFEWFDCEF